MLSLLPRPTVVFDIYISICVCNIVSLIRVLLIKKTLCILVLLCILCHVNEYVLYIGDCLRQLKHVKFGKL